MNVITEQMKSCLHRVHELMDSPAFHRDSSETDLWKAPFGELIMTVDDLLRHSRAAGQQIDFTEAVGVHGKVQDITSLIRWMRSCFPEQVADLLSQLPNSRLNRYFDRGNGYFANGSFFTTDYDDELAFFIDDQRIYLKHHIKRLVYEVEAYHA
ncbi:hypothetical protein GCM10027299_41890 [Larkinella ripae]